MSAARLIAIVAAMLAGCTVKPAVWERAQTLCERAGGVQYLYDFVVSGRRATAVCGDGTEISVWVKEPKQ